MQHVIKRQIIDVSLNKRQDSFRTQHLISSHYYQDILPALESVFNEFCSEDEVLVVDQLVIDLGVLSPADLELARWDPGFLSMFKAKLRENLAALSTTRAVRRESRHMNICRQWMFYMQQGFLNWNTFKVDQQWYNKVLETLATDYDGITLLRQQILENAKMIQRIVWQHDDVFLTKLTEILTARNQQGLAAALSEIYHVLNSIVGPHSQPLPDPLRFRKAIWQQILSLSAATPDNLSTAAIIAAILGPYSNELPAAPQAQKDLLSSVPVIRTVLAGLFSARNTQGRSATDTRRGAKKDKQIKDDNKPTTIKPRPGSDGGKEDQPGKKHADTEPDNKGRLSLEKENEQPEDIKKAAPAPAEADTHDKKAGDSAETEGQALSRHSSKEGREEAVPGFTLSDPADNPLPNATFNGDSPTQSSKPLYEQIPDGGIFIPHAGIVLVHPFLGSLFRRLQMVEGKEFIDTEARVKAVFLLHYLATGSTTADEFDLVLCKLLCAYPLEEPVPAGIAFTDAEQAEAADMLTALIQQWSKIGNTSIAGLREGFLQRSGKLFTKNEASFVQVESSAIDVLLDFLPWNLSLIRLPWMKEMVRVEWR